MLRVQRLDQRDQVLLGDERHLHVELSELEPSVGARSLVAQAPHDLVVAVLAAHHEQLLELLRRLRQRVERARPQPARHEEVARPFGRRPGEDRRLDLDEALLVHVLAHQPHDVRAHRQHLRHLGTTEVEVAEAQPQILAGLDAVLDRERRCLGGVQHLERGCCDLDVSGREVGVLHAVGPSSHGADDTHHVLGPEPLRGGMGVGRVFGMEDDLDDALTVAQVDERHAPVVAAVSHPPAERHAPAVVAGSQLAAGVRPHRRRER